MEYSQLSQEYQDDRLAEAMYAREVEFFHYDFDRVNFELMLKALPEGAFRGMIQARLDETLVQMAHVDAIYSALCSRIKDPLAHANAVERTGRKRQDSD